MEISIPDILCERIFPIGEIGRPPDGTTNTGGTRKPDNPLKIIRNLIAHNLNNPLKVIRDLVPNIIQS